MGRAVCWCTAVYCSLMINLISVASIGNVPTYISDFNIISEFSPVFLVHLGKGLSVLLIISKTQILLS